MRLWVWRVLRLRTQKDGCFAQDDRLVVGRQPVGSGVRLVVAVTA
jgi:hypothetical protein